MSTTINLIKLIFCIISSSTSIWTEGGGELSDLNRVGSKLLPWLPKLFWNKIKMNITMLWVTVWTKMLLKILLTPIGPFCLPLIHVFPHPNSHFWWKLRFWIFKLYLVACWVKKGKLYHCEVKMCILWILSGYSYAPFALLFVLTFDTKVTEYLCSGWVFFFFRQISTF